MNLVHEFRFINNELVTGHVDRDEKFVDVRPVRFQVYSKLRSYYEDESVPVQVIFLTGRGDYETYKPHEDVESQFGTVRATNVVAVTEAVEGDSVVIGHVKAVKVTIFGREFTLSVDPFIEVKRVDERERLNRVEVERRRAHDEARRAALRIIDNNETAKQVAVYLLDREPKRARRFSSGRRTYTDRELIELALEGHSRVIIESISGSGFCQRVKESLAAILEQRAVDRKRAGGQ